MKTFEELGLSQQLLAAITELGYATPMPVQEEVIPYLLGGGNDVVALAQTGTGKTAAYGLPILQTTDTGLNEPQALILSPTRELCLQIASDLTDYSKYIDGMRIQPVYGGSSVESQVRSLKKGVQIIVATPGRLIDLMNRGVARLDKIRRVVLDEADEMLSMGFSDDIDTILSAVPAGRDTLLFSATMSAEISRISKNYLHDAREIVVGTKNEGTRNVTHMAYVVHAKDKYPALKRVVDYYPKIYGIVFCRTRMETQEVADKLIQDGYNADALHGELSQQQRDLTMQKFRQHRIQLLVATDVAARGIDVDDLTHVINYGLPDDLEVYTHRSGRTGRADKKGISIAIIHLREKGKMRAIEKEIKKQFEIGKLPTGEQICEKQLYKMIDDVERVEVNDEEIDRFLPAVSRKLEWLSKDDLIKRMLSLEINRFVKYYANAAEIEDVTEEPREKGERKKGRKEKGSRKPESGFTRMFINVGRMDGIVPAKIIDMLNRKTHSRIEVGRIDLMQRFSFFEVREADADFVVGKMQGLSLNGREVTVEIAGDNNGTETGTDAAPKRRKSEGRRHEDAARQAGNEGGRRRQREHVAGRDDERKRRDEFGEKRARGRKDNDAKWEKRTTKAPKEDWRQFFQQGNELKGEIPDFSEEGWAKRSKKKR
ncbi:MAG: DEAD/DEAH box helicase [Bacteroidales bacterium]|nr:DEAD/DEAH box helicase [Bacteroidales bacterium]